MTSSIILAIFALPEKIGVNPQSMLWLLPLVASISIVYKATKIPAIKFASFFKEVIILFGSIVIFMIFTAVVLYALAWLLLE
jgi:hypothetical protein